MGLETDANLAHPFRLHRPDTLAEALEIVDELSRSGDEVAVMSGGQSLTVLLTSGLATPDHVVTLAGCRDTPDLHVDGRVVTIGTRTTVAEIEHDPRLADLAPALVAAASVVGSPHVRNFGTVVGNVCHADPGGDMVLPLLCYDAELLVQHRDGRRWIPIADVAQGPYVNGLNPGELGIALTFSALAARHEVYRKVMRRQGDLAMASACAVVDVYGGLRVALGGLLGRARRLDGVEQQHVPGGGMASREAIAASLDEIWDDLLVDPDDPGSEAFLRELAASLVADVVARALKGAS